jgi:DNA repair exonuclease SbcCD nuclease subunit
LKEIDIDYWALGHVHQAKVLSEAPAIAYSGTPQGLSPRETGNHGCYIVTTQEHRCAMEFIATDSIRWMDLQYSITEISTEEELLRALEDLLTGQREKENCALIARIDLTGRGLLHRSLQRSGSLLEIQDYLHQQIPDDIFIDRLRNRTLPDFDVEKKRQENNILGDFLRLCDSVNSDAEMRAKVLLALSDARDHPEIRSALDIHGSAEAENWLLHQLPKWLKQAEVEGADLLLAEDES